MKTREEPPLLAAMGGDPRPGASRGEKDSTWGAVIIARWAGSRVYRHGRASHLVNGKVMGTQRLRQFAADRAGPQLDWFKDRLQRTHGIRWHG